MALTTDQEAFLADFADKGIAEQQDIDARNQQVLLDATIEQARAAKQAELQAQADQLIATGMDEFEAQVVPTITVEQTAEPLTPSNA